MQGMGKEKILETTQMEDQIKKKLEITQHGENEMETRVMQGLM